MFSWPERSLRSFLALLATLVAALSGMLCAAQALAQTPYTGIGRTATPREVAAWDIDVRPDFKGLPKGAGSVAQGMEVWEAQCASCHGIFGESNEVFSPLVGGTTAQDVKTGRVASLKNNSFPGRTTLMKLSSVSTLWDYINRAMPWNAPKSLSVQEVYAVTAYLLNMGGVLPEGFVLSDRNIAEAQARLPNREGMNTEHGLWPGKRDAQGLGNGGKPDVQGLACMSNCQAEPKVASFLPDFARNSHGNLADQQRTVGPQRGALTGPAARPALAVAGAELALATQHNCTACHGAQNRIVGPGFTEIASKYAGRADAQAYLAGKIRGGGQGVWGAIPMPAQSLPDNDVKALAAWLATGAKK